MLTVKEIGKTEIANHKPSQKEKYDEEVSSEKMDDKEVSKEGSKKKEEEISYVKSSIVQPTQPARTLMRASLSGGPPQVVPAMTEKEANDFILSLSLPLTLQPTPEELKIIIYQSTEDIDEETLQDMYTQHMYDV